MPKPCCSILSTLNIFKHLQTFKQRVPIFQDDANYIILTVVVAVGGLETQNSIMDNQYGAFPGFQTIYHHQYMIYPKNPKDGLRSFSGTYCK
jgi:hypothetical protein